MDAPKPSLNAHPKLRTDTADLHEYAGTYVRRPNPIDLTLIKQSFHQFRRRRILLGLKRDHRNKRPGQMSSTSNKSIRFGTDLQLTKIAFSSSSAVIREAPCTLS